MIEKCDLERAKIFVTFCESPKNRFSHQLDDRNWFNDPKTQTDLQKAKKIRNFASKRC